MFNAVCSQYFPPKPKFTEKDVPPGSQVGKVFLVTGANQGIGLELVKMLYPTGATLYLAGRSQERIEKAIKQASAAAFTAQEKKLDILWNNTGIGGDPEGTTTKRAIEGHVGINCVAALLFTQELLPKLQEAAKTAPACSARIIWTGSLMIETHSPTGGIQYEFVEEGKTTNPARDYASSKVGNWYLAVEAAQRWGNYGIVSVVQNPGNLLTNIYSHQPKWLMAILKLVLYEPKLGAHTLLYSGFTPDVGIEKNNGAYIRPFGYVAPNGRQDIYMAIAAGEATKFWEWCEKMYQLHI
ncbi:hypothetical protein B0J11DRAFT_545455 [Dendryphion nanum]|uniref:NAD(P)-binding protein n=1 Tax=Dendryphion nanum TaxID=256645 RepID=A0A9P9CXE3_9PLEO|nr:hypothetical protein B0J11DRAFT_545455 [Dendryphion nanum]